MVNLQGILKPHEGHQRPASRTTILQSQLAISVSIRMNWGTLDRFWGNQRSESTMSAAGQGTKTDSRAPPSSKPPSIHLIQSYD